ncbi:MAG TPA: co-chaperone GroES [Candidatus Azoamicus sp. MARI]
MNEHIGIRPLGDKIVIKRIDERTTEGGIVIPDTIGNKSQKGIVVAVGPGKYEDGKIQKISLNQNDNIIFNKYSGTEITVKGKDYLIIKEDDILAVID